MAVRQITFRVEPEVADEFETLWRKAGFKSLQEAGPYAFRTAFAKWADVAGEVSPLPARLLVYPEKLREVLTSGNQDMTAAIVKILDVFSAALDAEPRRPKGR